MPGRELRLTEGDTLRVSVNNRLPAQTTVHWHGIPLVGSNDMDGVRLGMGERYDVLLEAGNPGVWQMAATPEGKDSLARTLLRYRESGESSPPSPSERPRELEGKLLTYGDLRASGRGFFPGDSIGSGPDRTHELTLSGGMRDYIWTIDGQRYPDAEPLRVAEGEWVRFEMQNRSAMWHPMHLHGHFFQIHNGTGKGPFKDTVLIDPHMGEMTFDFVADNPGDWFFHCHNTYHLETGMARVVSYEG